MNKSYDVYMCRERDYSQEEKDFKLSRLDYIFSNLREDTTLNEINNMIEISWQNKLKSLRRSGK